MDILNGVIRRNETNINAAGGTELMTERLLNMLTEEHKRDFQFIISRLRHPLDETKKRVLILHDLPNDSESNIIARHYHERFHKIVFVSHWQQQAFINHYRLPWSKTAVLKNAIEPIDISDSPFELRSGDSGVCRIIYHTTPHRGLKLLVPVVDELSKTYNVHLDVYSSFGVYGWGDRDEHFKDLFDYISNHEHMTYHGAVPNDEVREALKKSHIFAYPSIWPETSCISLMEAMSAGCVCIHPDFAALPETAANLTVQYTWQEDEEKHRDMLYRTLASVIRTMHDGNKSLAGMLHYQKSYADLFYSLEYRKTEWNSFLSSIEVEDTSLPKTDGYFIYGT